MHRVSFSDIESQLIKKICLFQEGHVTMKTVSPTFIACEFFFILQGKPNKGKLIVQLYFSARIERRKA